MPVAKGIMQSRDDCQFCIEKGCYTVVARGRETRNFGLAARSLVQYSIMRDTELVRVGHGRRYRKKFLYIYNRDCYIIYKVKKQPKEGCYTVVARGR
jgi:hypothetical protein